MMLIPARVCVPASTPRETPLTSRVTLPQGLLTDVIVYIPPGHAGVTGLRIKYGLENIIPYHEDSWITGDNIAVHDKPYWLLSEERNVLTIEAYNESTQYTHCFYLYFTVDKLMHRFEQVLINLQNILERQTEILQSLASLLGVKQTRPKPRGGRK